jgi:hypothetical protein
MKRALLLLSFCVAIPVGSAWAGIVATTDAAAFNSANIIDWCQLGCGGALADSAQTWTSAGLDTGQVGITGGVIYNMVAGTTPDPSAPPDPTLLVSNFTQGMGLVYNGVDFGNSPGPVFVFFDKPQLAVGAYISSDVFGEFTATITLFGSGGETLGTATTDGSASDLSDSALFFGAASLSGPVYGVEFSATGEGDDLLVPTPEPNFAIGTMRLGLGDLGSCLVDDDFCKEVEDEIPEPASLLLFTPALLGLVAFARRRKG